MFKVVSLVGSLMMALSLMGCGASNNVDASSALDNTANTAEVKHDPVQTAASSDPVFEAVRYDLSKNFEGFVKINKSKSLYVEYLAPRPNRPTVVLLNGLTYSTRQWQAMTVFLKKAGIGVLRYDMSGMGETLLKYKVQFRPYPYQDQVTELYELLQALRIRQPYHLVGLSYGGGIAAAFSFKYPETIENVVLMAPYTEPLAQQDEWIKNQVAITRAANPYNPYSDEEIYDHYLRQICYLTYPSVEPIVLENPFKLEAVFRMTQGIRHFQPIKEVHKFPTNSVHLIVAKDDQYIPQPILDKFWTAIPVRARASLTYVENSEHKLPEASPEVSAKIILNILARKK